MVVHPVSFHTANPTIHVHSPDATDFWRTLRIDSSILAVDEEKRILGAMELSSIVHHDPDFQNRKWIRKNWR